MFKVDKYSLSLIIAVGALGAGSVSAAEEAVSGSIRNTISRQSVSRQQVESDAENKARAGNAAYAEGQYRDAIEHYLAAVEILRSFDSKAFADRIERCRAQITNCYFYMAQEAVVKAEEKAQGRDFEEAIKLCKEAIGYYPEGEPAIQRKIAVFTKRQNAAEVAAKTGETTLLPNKAGQDYRMQVLMRQGQELAKVGDLQHAARKFQDILMIDPYNSEALHNLRSVNSRSAEIANRRYANQHRKVITELEWRWTNAVIPESEGLQDNPLDTPVEKTEVESVGINQKIRSIIIPRIEFEEVTIPTAIKFLQDESKRNDPEGKGVNIFLRRENQMALLAGGGAAAGGGVAAPPPVPAPGAADEGAAEAVVDPDANAPKISLIISKKSLFEALDFLCKAAKLEMRVEQYAVVLAPENVPLDTLETKVFPIANTAFGDGDAEKTPEMLKGFFVGVGFPDGSKIVYNPGIGRLIVTNTPANLLMIEEKIQEIRSEKDPLVEVSAKFMEVSQNDLKELGFDYTISYNPGNNPYPATTANADGNIAGYSSHRLSFGNSMSGLTRNNSTSELFVLSGFVGGSDGFNYTAKLFAANQMNSSDTLSSPRIMTLNGETATIRMFRKVTFAGEYDESELQQGSSGSNNNGGSNYQTYSKIGPFPDFDDEKELGIKMDVTPHVDKMRQTVTVKMFPEVTTFIGYTEFRSTDATGNEELVRKPIISTRSIDTTVTVADGETIVIGGVIDDQSTVINDKIPILGDLPIIGRFFQSKSTTAEKRNLLIFMTCRLVKPDGTPFYPHTRESRGLPTFERLD